MWSKILNIYAYVIYNESIDATSGSLRTWGGDVGRAISGLSEGSLVSHDKSIPHTVKTFGNVRWKKKPKNASLNDNDEDIDRGNDVNDNDDDDNDNDITMKIVDWIILFIL